MAFLPRSCPCLTSKNQSTPAAPSADKSTKKQQEVRSYGGRGSEDLFSLDPSQVSLTPGQMETQQQIPSPAADTTTGLRPAGQAQPILESPDCALAWGLQPCRGRGTLGPQRGCHYLLGSLRSQDHPQIFWSLWMKRYLIF